MAALVSLALAEDAVSVRKLRLRGVGETVLRRQLAGVATPRLRRFVFIRRVRLRAAPSQIGHAMGTALAKIAEEACQEFLTFPDFPALAVACAREALSGGGLTGWHWRTLGVLRAGTAGEAVAALLTAHALEAGAAVAALAEQKLLASVWRTMPEAAAAQLLSALAFAMGFSVPAWPDPSQSQPIGAMPSSLSPLLARTQAMWSDALRPLRQHSEPVRAAAVLSLLRWSPPVLRSGDRVAWQALLTGISHEPIGAVAQRENAIELRPSPDLTADASLSTKAADRARDATAARADPALHPDATAARADPALHPDAEPPSATDNPSSSAPHGEVIRTAWGGVLFLINALRRLHLEVLLDRIGPEAPTSWRLLHDLGTVFGMPEDEPLAEFLAAQDLDTHVPPGLLTEIMNDIQTLYQPDGSWPLPLAQLAVLHATETHLDLDLHVTETDIVLRLSGLDLDPGWVPWLGRVVAFHYDQLPTVFSQSG